MAGTNYYAAVTAAASQNFLGSTSPPGGPAMASVILQAPAGTDVDRRDDGGNIDRHVFDSSERSNERRNLHAQGLYEQSDDHPMCYAQHQLSLRRHAHRPLHPGYRRHPVLRDNYSQRLDGVFGEPTSTSPVSAPLAALSSVKPPDASDRIPFGDHRGGDRGLVHKSHR